MKYLISPELLCLEKTTTSLTLSHFGNISVYNSLNPDLTLEILGSVKKPKTLDQISRELKISKKKDMQLELNRLISFNYVCRVDKKNRENLKNSFLAQFAKNENLLQHLSALLAETRIALVDLNYETGALKHQMEQVGFKKVTKSSLSAIGKASASADFVIVVSDVQNNFQLSKINQVLFAQKKMWLLVTLDPYGGFIGPTFGLTGGPCYDCIIDHGKRQRYPSAGIQDLIKLGDSSQSGNRFFLAEGLFPFICTETVKIISKFIRPATFDGFYSFDLFNFRMQYNVVSPSPLCPVCSKYS